MTRVICNVYHSGNRRLAYDRRTDSYQCQGCGCFWSGAVVRSVRDNGLQPCGFTGSGGLRKESRCKP